MTIVTPYSALALFAAGPASLWAADWNWEPSIAAPMLVFGATYCIGAIRRDNLRRLRRRHASFALGWLSLLLALTSPIHELGEQLFSAHMLQHENMILMSAPLLAAAHPGATCLWAFARRYRSEIGGWIHWIESSAPMRFVSAPLNAWILEAV